MNPTPSSPDYPSWRLDVVVANMENDDYAETAIEELYTAVFLNSSSSDSTGLIISLNYNLPTMIVVATVLFLVIIATAIGNMLVGLALLRYQNLRTISNYLIGNLALSDFLLATTIFPLSTVKECLGHWVFGRAMCNVWLLTDVLYCTASLWNICVIAFDRFTATLYPIWYREKRSNRQAAMYVATVWLIASSICVPPLLGWNDLSQTYVYDNATDVYHCVLFQSPSYVLYSASGSFFVPFFLTVFLYVQIFIVLRKRMAKMRKAKGASSTRAAAAVMVVTKGPVVNQGQPNSTLRLTKTTKQTELEMTSAAVSSSHHQRPPPPGQSAAAEEESSLKSFLSSDSGDDLDQKRPLQGGGRASAASPSAAVRVVLRHRRGEGAPTHGATKTVGAAVGGRGEEGRGGGSHARPKCSAKFLTGWKLANWARGPRNGSTTRREDDDGGWERSTTTKRPNEEEDEEDETDNITTNLVEDEDEDDEDEIVVTVVENHRSGTSDRTTDNSTPSTVGGGHQYRKHRSLLGRLFKQRSWSSSASGTDSRQGSTTSREGAVGVAVIQQNLRRQQQQQHRRFDQREIQATIRMAIIIAFFCGMWLGFFAVYVVQRWCLRCSVSRELEAFFFWLGYSNSSVNPILYTIFNEDFRKAFQKILGCYRRRGEQNAAGSSSSARHHQTPLCRPLTHPQSR